MIGGAELLERLRDLPGGAELLELAAGREDVELVGGAVRDLLLGRVPRELDVVVEDERVSFPDAGPVFARELASRVDASSGSNQHERFGTAIVEWPAGRVDVATRRSEIYPAPGSLPEVCAGTPDEDLRRRDFTVNAIAVSLGRPRRGEVRAVAHGLEDLQAGRMRVLHDASFIDDPTRLLRLARYTARLGFEIEDHTEQLALQASRTGALDTISGGRVGAELRLALAEDDRVSSVSQLARLGILGALHSRLRFEEPLVQAAMALLPPLDGRGDLLLLTTLVLPLALRAGDDRDTEIRSLLDRLQFPAEDRERVAAAAVAVPDLIDALPSAVTPSQLRAAVAGAPVEGVALAGVLDAGAASAAKLWLQEVRNVRLEIDGSDLLAAGIAQGPEVGRRLELVLMLRLDGELAPGREAELEAALSEAATR
jgi:tRNA nucleotidyltransferase (CCA-adding enzyme)